MQFVVVVFNAVIMLFITVDLYASAVIENLLIRRRTIIVGNASGRRLRFCATKFVFLICGQLKSDTQRPLFNILISV